MRLEFRNPADEPVRGFAEMAVNSDSGNVKIRLPQNIPGRARIDVLGYAYFPSIGQNQAVQGAPQLTVAEWMREDGSRVARGALFGRPLVGSGIDAEDVGSAGTLLLLWSERADVAREDDRAHNGVAFAEMLTGTRAIIQPLEAATIERRFLPQKLVGYASARYVTIDGADVEALDQAQRRALLAHIRSGGVLVVSAPSADGAADPSTSWLGPFLPVQFIGRRELSEIRPVGRYAAGGGKPLPLRRPLPCTEAIEAASSAGTVLLADQDFVHAAYRSVGLGRVVFTSFPFNALDESDPRAAQLWHELLTTDQASAAWNDTALGEQQNVLLQQMIGRSVAPWQTAAIVVIGYTLLVLALQLALGGTRRPVAFAVALSVAMGVSLTLVILCHARRAEQRLGNASLAVIDAAPGGGGFQQQVTTYYGKNIRDMALTAAGPDVRFRPAFSSSSESPILEVQPFGVSNAQAWADKVEQVWQATATVEMERRAEVTGHFGPDGLRLTVTNQFGEPLRTPLLIWQNRAWSLPDVSLGVQGVVVGPSNHRGDYVNAAAFTSDAAKLRGQILSASLAPRSKNGFATNVSAVRADGGGAMVVGWLDEPAASRLLNSSPSLDDVRGQAMVRIPVMVEPTPPGTTVRIGEAFMRLDQGEQHGSPYDRVEELWPPTQQVGSWFFAFAPPREIGQLNPIQATLITILEAPQHTITIRKGQVSDGRGIAHGDPLGPIVARWANQIGPQSVTFPLGPQDVDTNGRVWLLLQVEGVSLDAGGAPAQWRFAELALSMLASVTGPPLSPPLATIPRRGVEEPAKQDLHGTEHAPN